MKFSRPFPRKEKSLTGKAPAHPFRKAVAQNHKIGNVKLEKLFAKAA